MEIITDRFYHKLNIDDYFKDMDCCFLDIETTGLSRKNNIIYLVGVLYFDKNYNLWTLTQLFANNQKEEKQLLEQLISMLSTFNNIITYNGDSFDIPFINYRLKYNSINHTISKSSSIDLYSIVKANKQILNFDNLKLKTIEENLGIFREDIYNGKDCIDFYYKYISSKDEILKDKILKHNYDDLYYMLDIIEILDLIKDKKSVNLVLNKKTIMLTIDEIFLYGDMFNINGFFNTNLEKEIIFFSQYFNIVTEEFNKFKASIEFKKAYITPTEKCIYIDKNDFEIPMYVKDLSGYKIPQNILILMIERKYCMDNIRSLLKQLFIQLV